MAGVTGIQKKAREAIPTTMLPPMPYPKITVLDGLAEESMKTRMPKALPPYDVPIFTFSA